jgi:hypothetical protein
MPPPCSGKPSQAQRLRNHAFQGTTALVYAVSTVFTRFLVPALYSVLDRVRRPIEQGDAEGEAAHA